MWYRQWVRIGQIAAEADVNVQTLRYYERRGILPEPDRSPSGYRAYPEETVQIIRFIKRAQDLGFTLDEIEALLQLRKNRRRSCRKVRTLAEAKLADVDEKLRRLRKLRRALATLVEACEQTGAALECPILEALDDRASPPRRSRAR